jgi:hypothetical protein
MTTAGGGWTRLMNYNFTNTSTWLDISDGGWVSWTFSGWFLWATLVVGWHQVKITDFTGSVTWLPVTQWFLKITAKPFVYNTWGGYTTVNSGSSMITTVALCDITNTWPSQYGYFVIKNWWIGVVNQRFSSGTFITSIAPIVAANKTMDNFFICIAPMGTDGANGYTYTPAFSNIEAYFR